MAQLVEFASNNLLLVSGLIGAWLVVMIYEMRLKAQTMTSVGTTDSVRLINKGAIVIDVRSPESYKDGHIVNSRNVEIDALPNDKAINKKKNKTFLTVCDDGMASSKAASALREAGIENAFSLKGGIRGWQAENLPLVK